MLYKRDIKRRIYKNPRGLDKIAVYIKKRKPCKQSYSWHEDIKFVYIWAGIRRWLLLQHQTEKNTTKRQRLLLIYYNEVKIKASNKEIASQKDKQRINIKKYVPVDGIRRRSLLRHQTEKNTTKRRRLLLLGHQLLSDIHIQQRSSL